MSQELVQQPTGIFPVGADAGKRDVGMDRIMQAKMKVLSGITQVRRQLLVLPFCYDKVTKAMLLKNSLSSRR